MLQTEAHLPNPRWNVQPFALPLSLSAWCAWHIGITSNTWNTKQCSPRQQLKSELYSDKIWEHCNFSSVTSPKVLLNQPSKPTNLRDFRYRKTLWYLDFLSSKDISTFFEPSEDSSLLLAALLFATIQWEALKIHALPCYLLYDKTRMYLWLQLEAIYIIRRLAMWFWFKINILTFISNYRSFGDGSLDSTFTIIFCTFMLRERGKNKTRVTF